MTQSRVLNKVLMGGAAFAALSLCLGAAHAQEVGDAESGENTRRLGPITVTATKVEESVQDVSASITALGADQLDLAGITDPTRLGLVVPGMTFGYSGGEARVAMRGARTNNVGPEAAQVVGIFNDGAYVATTTQVMASYLDVNRIEVLRGPQGTLYGRNTFAGTINLISNEPDFEEFGGSARGTLGDYNRTRFEGVLNVPVSDTFALRFAGLGEQHEGYIENTYLDGPRDDLRNEDVQIFRATARWQPTDNFETTLRYTTSERDTNGDAIWGYAIIGCYRNDLDPTTSTGLSASSTFVSGHCYQPGPNASGRTAPGGEATQQDRSPYSVARNTPSRNANEADSVNLQLEYDMGWATVNFIGALDSFEGIQYYDVDYSDGSFDGLDDLNNFFAGYDTKQDTQSYEVRLTSNPDAGSRLEWLIGAFYYKSEADWQFGFLNNGQFARYDTSANDTFNSTSAALFANATFSVTDQLRVLGGIRLNDDETILIGGRDGGTSDETLWKLGLEYDFGDDEMVYATASTGYRIGGVNGSALVAAGAPPSYGPEKVTAYEAGVKSTLLDGTLVLNAALFHNQYRDMHAQSFVTACIDPNLPATCIASEFTENGGEIDATGLEVEFNWLPGENWFVTGSASFLDSEFGEYNVGRVSGLGNFEGRQDVTLTTGEIVAAGGVPSLSLEGWTPALNPEFTAALQVGYDFDLGGGNTLTPVFQTSYSSEYWSFDFNVPGSEQGSYTKSDIRLIWRNDDHGFEVEGFIENLEDEAVLTRSVIFTPSEPDVVSAAIQANYADPRIWGIRLGVDF